jgi:hypothetical protein
MDQDEFTQHFIFGVTYELIQEATVFVPDKHFQPTKM